jgi:hypothetical protein
MPSRRQKHERGGRHALTAEKAGLICPAGNRSDRVMSLLLMTIACLKRRRRGFMARMRARA